MSTPRLVRILFEGAKPVPVSSTVPSIETGDGVAPRMTGNAAGETAGNLQAVASRVDAIVGTQAQAAEILAQLVSTGNVSRAQLEQGTQAAIELQRTFGIEADKTVAALSALGRDPVRAIIFFRLAARGA